jgi:hypothetical protein
VHEEQVLTPGTPFDEAEGQVQHGHRRLAAGLDRPFIALVAIARKNADAVVEVTLAPDGLIEADLQRMSSRRGIVPDAPPKRVE